MTTTIDRNDLRSLLQRLTEVKDGHPKYPIFSVRCARRTPLYLRYEPVNDLTDGPLAREGDCCVIGDDHNLITDQNGRKYESTPTDSDDLAKHHIGRSPIFMRRAGKAGSGDKIILEDIGTFRWMIVKNYDRNAPLTDRKHYSTNKVEALKEKGLVPNDFTNTQRDRNYDPADYDLFQVYGMYNDAVKNGRIGRYGQWRPWAQICLRSTVMVKVNHEVYSVPDPIMPTAEPIKLRLIA